MTTESGPPWPAFVDALSTVLMMMVFFTLLMVLVTGTLSYIVALKEVTPGAANSVEKVETMVAAAQDLAFMEKPSSMDQLQEALGNEAKLGQSDYMAGHASPVVSAAQLNKKNEELVARLTQATNELNKLKKNSDSDAEQKLKEALEKIAQLEASGALDKTIQNEDTYEPPAFVTKLVKGINNNNRVIILYNQLTSTLDEKTKVELMAWIKQNKAAIEQRGLLLAASLNHKGVSSSMSNSVSFKRLYGLINMVTTQGKISKKDIKFRALSDAVPGTNQVVISLGKK